MPIVRIKTCDAAGQPLANQTVQVTGCDQLSTNAAGMSQFLIDPGVPASVVINGVTVWSGSSDALKKDEVFSVTNAGCERL